MSILIDKNTNILIQGITGKEGSRAEKDMILYGAKVVAGGTPGKGGQNKESLFLILSDQLLKNFLKFQPH